MKKLLLIDGHALIFRSYYAFLRRPMINSKGVDTSILFGFTKTILELIMKERPTHFAVAFDPPCKTFRHEIFSGYKANRSETPEQIKAALDPLIQLMDAVSVPVLMKDGFEADDVIGTIATEASQNGFNVYMVTPDKDYGQLVTGNIFQYKPAKNGNEPEIMGVEEICSYYNIESPRQLIDILTIWGDASDNIPGVKGIGEVSSKKLIGRYKSVENIYNSLDELPEKQKNAFEEAKGHIELSKRLVTIDKSVDINWDEESLRLATPDFSKIKELFTQYEFGSLLRMLPQLESLFTLTPKSDDGRRIKEDAGRETEYSVTGIDEIIKEAEKTGVLAAKITENKILICSNNLISSLNPHSAEEVLRVKGIMENSGIIKCGYNLKQIINMFRTHSVQLNGTLGDIELMHYLLMPERSHKIEILARGFLGIEIQSDDDKAPKDLFSEAENSDEQNDTRAYKECSLIEPLYNKLSASLENEKLTSLYSEIEMPLLKVLANMENCGINLDVNLLREYSKTLTAQLDSIEQTVREMAGESDLNISSPKQLGILLYEKLNIVKEAKKTSKKNYSTDEETLNEISHLHPIIGQILEYRAIKKLLSTYIDPLPSIVDPKTHKIHTTYNQALTATGRLSSVKPNLQNIPIRTQRGKEIRKAFIPGYEGGCIMSADYSQIELRLMAHMSGDEHFIEAFRMGKDIHSATASKIFQIPEEQLTREQRGKAKTANFGIIYGISAFGLSQRLAISRAEAKTLIGGYFQNYPKVESYMQQMIQNARENGYVSTLYGRKRYLPDINSKNPVVRGLAERNAINAPIQGSAADIIKVAMIRVFERIGKEELKSRMVLQVHDELVFDIFPGEEELMTQIVKKEMEGVIELSVPLTVDCQCGANWLEAH